MVFGEAKIFSQLRGLDSCGKRYFNVSNVATSILSKYLCWDVEVYKLKEHDRDIWA